MLYVNLSESLRDLEKIKGKLKLPFPPQLLYNKKSFFYGTLSLLFVSAEQFSSVL